MDKVSIVVPVYNMEDKIEKCVQSLINQTYRNIEIILVDDGSKDDSYAHCMQLAECDSRIVVLHTENCGSGPARNYGIENATGKYIYFPDADDYLAPDAINILVDAMEEGRYDLVVFGFRNVNQDGKEISVKRYENSEKDGDAIRNSYSPYMTTKSEFGIQGAPWNKFFDLGVIREFRVEYPPLRRHQDEGFISRYMCHAKRVHFIENVLYTYYVNDLQAEWKKYPVDYIDSVIGLNEMRQQTILRWNLQDKKTQELIDNEYICNVIKALELSFSPKMNFNKKERKQWMLEQIKRTNIANARVPSFLGKYQVKIINFIRLEKYKTLYFALHMKIMIEKSALFSLLRG